MSYFRNGGPSLCAVCSALFSIFLATPPYLDVLTVHRPRMCNFTSYSEGRTNIFQGCENEIFSKCFG